MLTVVHEALQFVSIDFTDQRYSIKEWDEHWSTHDLPEIVNQRYSIIKKDILKGAIPVRQKSKKVLFGEYL